MIKKYKETVGAEKAALTDQDLEKVAGGVGGANEATCPICGIPMRKTDSGFGDPFWVCDKCGTNQIVSDAEFTLGLLNRLKKETKKWVLKRPWKWMSSSKKSLEALSFPMSCSRATALE